MSLNLSLKKYLSVSVSLAQILSTSLVNLSAADLRPRNHIQPLGNNSFTPQMNTSANGRDVVNIVNPNSEGISHNKYESFDIAKDNGVILNNSQENGVSVTGGFVGANPNLSLNARLIINEILSNKNTSLEGTLEVFGKNADIIIANENGLIINGASFINAGGITLTTGLIDDINKQILVRQGEVNILKAGVGLDGDYFSIISKSMQLSGSISKLDGNPLKKINFIAGMNDVKLATDMNEPVINATIQSNSEKPKLSIDGNMLGSMYAGYIHFISTEEGVGVRHSGVIRSASDIVIDAKGDIQTAALIAQNVDLKTSKDFNNEGVIIADNKIAVQAQSLNNFDTANAEMMKKLGLDLQTSYFQAENVDLKLTNLFNQGKIVGFKSLYASSLGDFGEFQNSGNMSSEDILIQTSVFNNKGSIFSSNLKLEVSEKNTNSGDIQSNSLNVQTKDFLNQGSIKSDLATFNLESLENQGKIQTDNLELDAQKLSNDSQISTSNAKLDVQKIENSGKIESKNQLFLIFKDVSKNLSEVLHNSNGILHSDNILSIKSGSVDIDSEIGKMSANGKLLIESSGDISIKKTFSNTGSIGLKAVGSISNESDMLLASQNDIYLNAKAFLNNTGGYIFGKNIAIEADNITNGENSTIDAQLTLSLKADTINNNMGVINSGTDMELSVRTLKNNAKTLGSLEFTNTIPGWLHYYFAKDYFGNRNFNASYIAYNITNTLENKQAVIKSGGNLKIGFGDSGKTDIYNNNSVIAAAKNIDIVGNVYNTTSQKEYNVGDLLKRFSIESIEATPTYAGNTTVYRLGSGNPLEVLDKAKYSKDDNAGYFGLLKDLATKNQLFKSLMAKGFGINWLSENDPNELILNEVATLSFTPKNPAQIVARNDINISGGAIYNSTGSAQKINTDINNIKTNLKDIQGFDVGTAGKTPEKEDSDKSQNKEPLKDKGNSKEVILQSSGLSQEQILGLGDQLLFHTSSDTLNSKINYYIETRADLVDMSKFYGSQYFFAQAGYAPDKPISVIGDAYYENRLLNEQLTQNLGYSNALNADDIKSFLDNAVLEQKKLGLVVGEALSEDQISKLDKDIAWYVNKKINGEDILVPQLYYSQNSSFRKNPVSEGSNIASSGNLFLDVGVFQNQSSNLNAGGVLAINAKGDAKNIGGVISADKIAINAKTFTSQSQLGIDKSGNFDTLNQAKLVSKGDITITTQGNIDIQNSSIISNGKDSKINLISKNGLIQILDDTTKKIDYKQESKQSWDSSWASTTVTSTSSSSSSVIQGDNINFKATEGITIKGSSLVQTSKDGNINLISDGNINIVSGSKDSDIKTQTSFSGVNAQSGMLEYSTTANTNEKQHQALNSFIGALGNIYIQSNKDLSIDSSVLESNKKVILSAEGKVDILDSQNTSTLSSSYTSYQALGLKGGSQNEFSSTSLGSSLKGNEGILIDSKKSTHIVGSELDSQNGDVIFLSKENLKIEAGKNTLKQESTSYGFGIVGSVSAGAMGSKVSAGFGINEGQNLSAQSNFDSKTLTSGKIQMDSLAQAEVGLEFSYNSQTSNSTHYANSNIKTKGDIKGIVDGIADIGGGNLDASKDIILQASSIETSKYVDESITNSTGFNLSIKQKAHLTSSALDTMNMISDVATEASKGKNLNAGVLAAGAVGSVTNLIFNDLIGALSTQEGSFQINHQNSYKTSENITELKAGGNILIQSTKGDIDLMGVAIKGDSLSLDSANNINIGAAKSTNVESGFSFGLQARLQESAGYSALWGNNTDVGVGGNVNVSYNQNNEISYQNSNLGIKDQVNIISKNDLNIVGGKINAGSADVQVGGNLNIASIIDSKDSKNLNANLGGDVSLGVGSNTIGKGNFSLNGGGGYYYQNSKNVNTQSGILTEGKLNLNIKGNANLQGSVLDSKTQEGLFEIAGKLSISDFDLHNDIGGGSGNLSGGLSGNFGGQINVGDYESEKSTLHSAINIGLKGENGVVINGKKASINDIYSDTEKTRTILSSNSFSGGDISFSVDTNRIREALGSQTHHLHTNEDSSLKNADESIILGARKPNEKEIIALGDEKSFYVSSSQEVPENHSSKQDSGFKETLVLQYSENNEQPNLAPPSPKKQKLEPGDGNLPESIAGEQGSNPQVEAVLSASELSWMQHLSDLNSGEGSSSQAIAIEGKKLGVGSYGEVYLINHEGKDYALKVPTKPEYLANLNQEAQILNSIPEHPNIVKTEGIKEIQGQNGLLIEYVQGHKLDSVLGALKDAYDNNKINHSEFYGSVSNLTKGILEGLNHLENNSIVHGDIKGNNILVDVENYEPKIIDFGLARAVGEEGRAGNASFAPPEMLDSLLGISHNQSANSKQDVYAIGQFVHQIGEGQNHLFGVAPEAIALEYAMKKKIEKLNNEGNFESYQPLSKQEQNAFKEPGKYAYEGDYVKFVNGALAVDHQKRLGAKDLLESNFIKDPLIQPHELPNVLGKAGIELGGFETFLQGHYSEHPEQPNLAPPSIHPNAPEESSVNSPVLSTQVAESNLQMPSLAQKIKNFFRKNKGSYNVQDTSIAPEDVQSLSYKKIYDDLPIKSASTLAEQAMMKHEKDLIKFAAMGEEVPPRVPIKQEKRSAEGDVKDLEDFIDRSIFEVQTLNLSETVNILKGVQRNPIFSENSKEESLRHYFVELLSEVGEHFPYHPDSRDYKNIRGKIHEDVDNKIMNNPKIQEYITNFDPSNQKHFENLAKEIVQHYTEAIKNANLNITDTKIHFSENFQDAFYSQSDDDIHIPAPNEYKDSYFKNKNPTPEEVGLHVLNAVVHEMTHKQQNVFVANIDNPVISENVRDYASIIDLNFKIYANARKDGYDLYRSQILEREAFDHGENAMKKFENLLKNSSQPSDVALSSPLENANANFHRPSNNHSDDSINFMIASADEQSPKIEHLLSPNKNLETKLENEPNFSNIALVYGLSSNRGLLIQSMPSEEIRKRPLIADDYLEALNANESPEKEKRFYDFAKSVAVGNENLLKNTILDYKEPVEGPRDEGVNSIPRKDNQKIFEDLLSNEDTRKIIKNIDANKNAMKAIEQIAKDQNLKELDSFIRQGVANTEKFTSEEKRLYNLYMKYASALDEERFFGAKTIGVLKNVLDSGGKIYFNLDGLVTNYHPYTDRVKDVDLKKLKNVFDHNDEYYESVTAEELRYVYEKYAEHPNLKFTIKKQVIENPFKSPDVIEAIKSQLDLSK